MPLKGVKLVCSEASLVKSHSRAMLLVFVTASNYPAKPAIAAN